MKRIFAAAMIVAMSAGAALADPVDGVWKTEPGDTGGWLHVQMYGCGSKVCGKIAAAYDKTGKKVGDYQHLGKKMIRDMSSKDGKSYSGGKIWNPENDKTYVSTMKRNGSKLAVKGCVAGGLICKNAGNWTRVK